MNFFRLSVFQFKLWRPFMILFIVTKVIIMRELFNNKKLWSIEPMLNSWYLNVTLVECSIGFSQVRVVEGIQKDKQGVFGYYKIYFFIFYVTLFSDLDSKYDYDYARRWMEGIQNSLELVFFQLSLAVQHSGGLTHITYCAFDMKFL